MRTKAKRYMPGSWTFKPSLQTRVLVLTTLISASVLVITEWLATVSSVQVLEHAAGKDAATIVANLVTALQRLPSTASAAAQSDARQVIELEPEVSRVDVYVGSRGDLKLLTTTASTGKSEPGRKEKAAFDKGKAASFVTQGNSGRQLFYVRPFRFDDGQQGLVTLVRSLQGADQIFSTYSRIRNYSLLFTLVLLVLALRLLFRFTVYRSMLHLLDVMHRFKKGEATARAETTMPGEFAELAGNLNLLLDEVQQFDDRLRQGIQAATKELAARNRALRELNLQLYDIQKRLTQAERLALAGHLTATLAHEIGSPLSAISTHMQMLLEEPEMDPKVLSRLHLINEQTDRVCNIVEGLLATTRRSPRRVPVNLEEVIRDVVRLLEPTLESRQIRFEFRASGGPFQVQGDPDQLHQLFLNLFNNSLDAIQGSGRLSVEIHREAAVGEDGRRFLQVDVSDSGVGIPAEKLDHIFESLFTTKAFGKGSGLGLAISRGIVTQHGGRISVVSQEGKGTCFTIHLPEIGAARADSVEPHRIQEIEP